MAPKQMFFDWKIGQFACIRYAYGGDEHAPKVWHFAEIARIIPARTHAETMAEIYLYYQMKRAKRKCTFVSERSAGKIGSNTPRLATVVRERRGLSWKAKRA